jgi:hypothetical protein
MKQFQRTQAMMPRRPRSVEETLQPRLFTNTTETLAGYAGKAINDAMLGDTSGALSKALSGVAPRKLFIGPGSQAWDEQAAFQASKMEAAKASPQEIWAKTGTFRGPDGHWRQEISDKGSTVGLSQRSGSAEEIFKHPELYAAYPELAGTKMNLYGTMKGAPEIKASLSGTPKEGFQVDIYEPGIKDGPRLSAIHEMQHAIQDIEGFSPGGNRSQAFLHPSFQEIKQDTLKTLRPAGGPIDPVLLNNLAADSYYYRLGGEAEARAAARRANMDEAERKATFPLESYDMLPDRIINIAPYAGGGYVDGTHADDGIGASGVDQWRADNSAGGLAHMADGGVPYKGINPMATGLGQMRQQSVARDAASSLMAKNRAAQFANQGADRLARQNQLAAAKTARLNALAPKLSTYVPPAGSTTTSPTVTSPAVTDPATTTVDSTTPIVPAAKPDDPGNYQGGARGGLVSMADGGIVRMSKGGKFGAPIEAAAKTFKALPGQSFQGKTGLSVLSPDEEARRLIAKMDQPSIEDVLKTVEEPKPVTAAQRAAAGRAAAKQIAATQVQKLSDVLGNLNIEGKGSLGVGQSDRTRVGGGNIGGANFPGIQHADPLYEGMGWGVGNVPTASNLISNFASPGKYFTTLLGSEHQLKTNPVVFERLKKGFLQAMKEGKLGPELEAKINHNLALTFGEGADIRDPQIWKKANTFEKRAALGDIMLGRGIPPKKGGVALGGEKSGKGVIFNPSDILREETEKMLLHPEHGGNVPTFAVGPRLVQFSGDYSVRPDLHPGFPVLLHGKDMNVVFSPVPGEIALPDFVAELAKPSEKFPKGKKPGYYEWTMGLPGKGLPSQPITEEYLRHLQREGFKKGGKVKKMQAGGKAIVSGLQAIAKPAKQTITSAIDPTMDIASRLSQPDRINLLPMPSRWFLDPKNNPNVQKLVEKVLEVNNMKRSDFYSGAFVNPRTGEVMDKKVMQDVGVLINPNTGRPMMSAEKETDLTIGDRKKGSITKSNLVRKQLYETEGDPILKDLDFLVAIEQSGMGHKYGLATEYATPAEMFNTMTGDNPTLRPKSQGDVFGIGDIVGRMSMKSSKMPHDVYESLLIAPKGSDVQGVKLSKKKGGIVKGRK